MLPLPLPYWGREDVAMWQQNHRRVLCRTERWYACRNLIWTCLIVMECCQFPERKKCHGFFWSSGELHLELDWSPADVVSEIKTTFSDVMKNDDF